MTSEVVLMNRGAIALAADSAVTVTGWHNGRSEQRFFKGANKIFNLSRSQPVGLMVYNSATILGVPIEVVVKAYRAKLKNNSFGGLEGYATDFFHYLASETRLFPAAYQDEQFLSLAVNQAIFLIFACKSGDEYKNERDPAKKDELMSAQWELKKADIEAAEFLGQADGDDIASAIEVHKDGLISELTENKVEEAIGPLSIDDLAESAIAAIYKAGHSHLDHTGIVIAGFGEDEFFPSCFSYDCFGIVRGKVLFAQSNKQEISHESISHVLPLAQSDMVNTFINGVGPTALAEIHSVMERCLEDSGLLETVEPERRMEIKDKIGGDFYDAALNKLFETHSIPLRRVIGSFSIDELAQLAETLITIESLKERVTRPTESVSGPVDVAVISKGDGFIWIRRKHYFEPGLNPRYAARIGG